MPSLRRPGTFTDNRIMKKTYMQPMVMVYGLEAATIMAGSEGNGVPSATYGDDNEPETKTDDITTVGDNDGFIMEAKKNNNWSDWGE